MGTLYKKLLLIMMITIAGHPLAAQEKVSKKITETYEMSNSGALHITNKYGNVTVNGWSKNSIEVVIDIKVSHKKNDNAKNLLDRISPNINISGEFITVSSEISEKNTSFFTRYFNKANPFDFDRSNIQIDYTINMPKSAELTITNKFGDVVIDNWNGKLKTDIQHGDIWINNALNNADMVVRYGKIRAKSLKNGIIRLKNGSIDLERSKDLRITSSGSNIKIGEVTALEIYSNKDEITVEEAESVIGDLKFTNMQLNNIDDEIDLKMRVADFMVGNIHSSDAKLSFHQESSEIELNIDGFGFKFDATLQEGLLRLPKSFKNVDSKMIDKGNRIREITATYGKDTLGTISITGVKGAVLLKE